MSGGRALLPIAAFFLLVACDKPAEPPRRFMLVASGSPGCLGELAGKMIDGGFGASEAPIFRGHLSTIRFGPVDERRLGLAIQNVKQTACATLARVEKK